MQPIHPTDEQREAANESESRGKPRWQKPVLIDLKTLVSIETGNAQGGPEGDNAAIAATYYPGSQ